MRALAVLNKNVTQLEVNMKHAASNFSNKISVCQIKIVLFFWNGRIKYNPIIQREMLLVTTAKLTIAKLFNIDLFSLFNITRSYKIKKNYFQQKC